jgi:hypothetical protein
MHGSHGHFQHCAFACRGAFLGQMPHDNVSLARDRSLVRFLSAEDKREQSGFAGAVGADQADAVAAIKLQRHIFKQNLRPVSLANF